MLFLRRLLLVLLLPGGACVAFGDERDEVQEAQVALEPKQQLAPQPHYTGPIDPEWPPSRPADLKVALEASRLYRKTLQGGKRPKEPAYRHQGKGLFVEEGKIGAFHYIEVVLGEHAHPDHPMPLIVILHGRGGKPTIPEGPYDTTVPLRLFIPQGPDQLGSGYNWLATWTNAGQEQLLTRSLAARADELAPAIRAFRALRPTLGKPVVLGFSQGGILSFALATRYPGDFSAAFPIAGWLPPTLYPEPSKVDKFPYIFAQHGGADPVVPTEKGRQTVRELRRRGLHVDYKETPGVGHVVTAAMNGDVRDALRRFVSGYVGGDWAASERALRRREVLAQTAPTKAAPRPAPASAVGVKTPAANKATTSAAVSSKPAPGTSVPSKAGLSTPSPRTAPPSRSAPSTPSSSKPAVSKTSVSVTPGGAAPGTQNPTRAPASTTDALVP